MPRPPRSYGACLAVDGDTPSTWQVWSSAVPQDRPGGYLVALPGTARNRPAVHSAVDPGERRTGQVPGTASWGTVCQLVTTGLSTVMLPVSRLTGPVLSSLLTVAMTALSSLPPSVPVVLGFTPA